MDGHLKSRKRKTVSVFKIFEMMNWPVFVPFVLVAVVDVVVIFAVVR